MIRTVFFDLDDTLLDFHKAERVALTKTLLHFGIEPQESVLRRYSELNLAQWKRLERGEITRDEVKVRRYQLLFEELQIDCSPADATAYYGAKLAIGHYFVDGAEEMLQQCAAAYTLYLISNGDAAIQNSRLQSAGILPLFADAFISQTVGFDKPDPAFFTHCFAQIPDFCRETAVIVGDSLSSDIRGGNGVGVRTVWFNPTGAAATGAVPDETISHLSELPPLLARL